MSKLRYVGLDVHKDTIVMAVAEEGQGAALLGHRHGIAVAARKAVERGVGLERAAVAPVERGCDPK